MSYRGSWKIDDYLTFVANTHDPDTGVATDADSVPTYRVYEDETGTPILTGSMALLDAANTTGFYSERIQLTTANGFEKGKCYTVYITATVDSDTGTMHHNFQIEAEVDANTVSATPDVNVTQISGDSGAANNAETFFDGTGYAGTNNVIPTVSALTGHTVQTGDNFARIGAPAGASIAADIADVPTVAEMNARTQPTADYFDPAADAVANVTLVATTTTNTDMVGTDSAALASVCTEARLAELAAANLPADVDAILADTNELQTDDIPGAISGLNDPTAAAVRTEIDSNSTQLAAIVADTNELQTDWADGGRLDLLLDGASAPSAATVADAVWDEVSAGHTNAGKAGQQLWTDLDAVLADTAELQTDDVPGLIAALNDIAVTDITQRQIPDSVPADGALPTIEQALYMITQFLYERAISGTTMTVKKADGLTTLITLTLDDGTDPTSYTRTT